MRRTFISELVSQYISTLKNQKVTPELLYGAARAGGNHNRVNLLQGGYSWNRYY